MESGAFNERVHSLIASRRIEEASCLVEDRLRENPSDPIAHYARGVVAMFSGDFATAEADMHFVRSRMPAFAAAHHNLGALAQWRKEYEASIRHFRRALELEPTASHSAVSLAHSLLALGRYREGWQFFETRAGGLARIPRPKGLWDGTPIPHGALAVFGEEGIGDVVQFCRYIPAIRSRVASLYLVLDGQFSGLAPLLASLAGPTAIVTDRSAGPPVNAYCPIMTLAHIAGASTANAGRTPYLKAPEERVAAWRSRLGNTDRLRVGLVWGGNPRAEARASDIDSRRSIDPALLAPLGDIEGVEWHSLQLGSAARQRERVPQALGLIDMTAQIRDFGDTAALIENLDLVVTVDTSVAHVAGAVGAPVWMLNRFDTCWRWGPSGETTPWYPTMRIFRQRTFGDWTGAIAEVAVALAARAARQRSGS